MNISARVENGKAYLEFDFKPEVRASYPEALIQMFDGSGEEVWSCLYPLTEEEPAAGILLHPHLWNGLADPYRYRVKINFRDKSKKMIAGQEQYVAICNMEEIPGKGLFLNGKPFAVRGVRLDETNRNPFVLEALYKMGANTLYLSERNATEEFLNQCAEMGFWVAYEDGADAPDVLGSLNAADGANGADGVNVPEWGDSYYYYMAQWSNVPFVYISRNSICKSANGRLSLKVYSNRKKVALYVDGVLFEFLTGGPEYLFEEIPTNKYPLTLTADAGECSTAVTLYE